MLTNAEIAVAEPGVSGYHDPNLYLMVTDDIILSRENLVRFPMTLRRESVEPAFPTLAKISEDCIGYTTAAQDPESGQLRLWYQSHNDGKVRLATSDDGGQTWERQGLAVPLDGAAQIDNLSVAQTGLDVDSYFRGAKYVATACCNRPLPGQSNGIFALRSNDGKKFEIQTPAILPGVGDRSSVCFDDATGEYLFFCRPYYGMIPGMPIGNETRHRMARLWKSRDLVNWTDYGVVLKHDDQDPPDVQIYGMQAFRYGRGFLAFLEILHQDTERLDAQLAWSPDGMEWHRVNNRQPILPNGGEGAWDSHIVSPTLNAPMDHGDRLLIPYLGANTKHASGKRHRKAIGLATIRRDGWCSLEAGRTRIGQLVTHELPLQSAMRLELNVNCYSGWIAVDVLSVDGSVIEGYSADASRIEKIDSIRHRVHWGERDVVDSGVDRCRLRITMQQGSLFSFRWSAVEDESIHSDPGVE